MKASIYFGSQFRVWSIIGSEREPWQQECEAADHIACLGWVFQPPIMESIPRELSLGDSIKVTILTILGGYVPFPPAHSETPKHSTSLSTGRVNAGGQENQFYGFCAIQIIFKQPVAGN